MKHVVRSGYVRWDSFYIKLAGIDGHSWSSMTLDFVSMNSAKSYDLLFNRTSTQSSSETYSRRYGFPVRCLASGA